MLSPGVDDCSSIFDAGEPVEIEAVRAELAVEALDEGVLGRFAGLDEVQLDAALLRLRLNASPTECLSFWNVARSSIV